MVKIEIWTHAAGQRIFCFCGSITFKYLKLRFVKIEIWTHAAGQSIFCFCGCTCSSINKDVDPGTRGTW